MTAGHRLRAIRHIAHHVNAESATTRRSVATAVASDQTSSTITVQLDEGTELTVPNLGSPATPGDTVVVMSDGDQAWVESPGSVRTEPALYVRSFGAVGDGVTNCGPAFEAAVAAASTLPAGVATVCIPAGTWIVDREIVVPAGIHIKGAGVGQTLIQVDDSADIGSVFAVADTTQYNYQCTFSDFMIWGRADQGAEVDHGIYAAGLTDSIIRNVRLSQISGNGITLTGVASFPGTANEIQGVVVRECGLNGIYIASNMFDTRIAGCDVGACGDSGLNILSTQVSVANSMFWGNLFGMYCAADSRIVWATGCRFDQNEKNGVAIAGKHVRLGDCYFYNNSQQSTGDFAGVLVQGDSGSEIAEHIHIADCTALNGLGAPQADSSYGVELGNNHADVMILDCDFDDVDDKIGGTPVASDHVRLKGDSGRRWWEGVEDVADAATFINVFFPVAQPDTNYEVLVTCAWGSVVSITNKTTTKCDVNFTTSPSGASKLAWQLVRDPV